MTIGGQAGWRNRFVRASILLVVSALRAQQLPCGLVQAGIRAFELAKLPPDPELQTAAAACGQGGHQLSAASLLASLDRAAAKLAGHDRLEVLPALSKSALRAGELDQAQTFARELLQLASKFTRDPLYGGAIYDGYTVLGLVALRRDNLMLARQYLLDAGSTPGSASLSRNGPGMSLARELLERNQEPVVLRFFLLCKEFWKNDNGKLLAWTEAVSKHEMPDFGPNLEY